MTVLRIVPVLTVDDVATAVSHHVDVLGMREVMNHGWIATIIDDATNAQLSVMTADATASCNPSVSVEVDDVDAAYRRAADAGVEIVHALADEEWGVRRFFYRAADGAVINVLSHR